MSLKVTFGILNLCNAYNSGNGFSCNVFTHKSNANTACDLNFIVNDEGLFKVTGSHIHVHCKSGNISETVLDRDVVTTGH